MGIDHHVALSMEIGGKQTTIALVDRQGKVRQRRQAKTLRGRPALATLRPYLHAIDELLLAARRDGLSVCGIGVSVPGALDAAAARPLQVSLLPSLNGFPLRDFLSMRYQLPCLLQVDVEAAVLGEHRFGAGRGCSRLLFLAVNAVVGAALVVDGQVEHGIRAMGHICHLAVANSGPRCSCGKHGCINTLISLDAVQRMVLRALRRGTESALTQRLINHEGFSPELLLEEVERGDSLALQIYSDIGRWLGVAVTKYVDLFDPHVLVLGGGVLYAHDLLLTQVQQALHCAGGKARVCSVVEVVPACLGNDAMLIGSVVPLF
jgi:glucokinase